MGYDMCFRDSMGVLLLGKSDFYYSSATVLEVESLGLLDAIKVAISHWMCDVMFETDSKILFDVIATTTTPINEFGDLVTQCRSLLLNRPDFVVSYVTGKQIELFIVLLEHHYLTLAPISFIM